MPLVEVLELVAVDGGVADALEKPEEVAAVLPVHLVKLDHLQVDVVEAVGTEEVRGGVAQAEKFPLGFAADDRRELKQVPEQNDLHPAEGLATVAVQAQAVVDRLHHVGADHADLIDDQDLQVHEDALVAAVRPDIFRLQQPRWKVKEAVDGLPAYVQRRHACGGQHHDVLAGGALEYLQEGRLAGPRPPRDEQVGPGFHPLEGVVKFRGKLQGFGHGAKVGNRPGAGSDSIGGKYHPAPRYFCPLLAATLSP